MYSIQEAFDNKKYKIDSDYSYENDGIGHYEAYGVKGFNKGVDYIIGQILFVFEGLDSTDKEIEDFIENSEDEITQESKSFIHSENAKDFEIDYFCPNDNIIKVRFQYFIYNLK